MMNDEDFSKLICKIEESNRKTIYEANERQTEIIKQHVEKEISSVINRFEKELERISSDFEAKYNKLNDKFDQLEKFQRKNNVIIFGLPPVKENLLGHVLQILNQHLQLNIQSSEVNNVYTFGRNPNKKPVVLSLISYIRKQEIVKNSRLLKPTGIFISDDLTVKERQDQQTLRHHLKIARSEGQDAFIRNKKLTINGRIFTPRELISHNTEIAEQFSNSVEVALLDVNDTPNIAEVNNVLKPITTTSTNIGDSEEEESEDGQLVEAETKVFTLKNRNKKKEEEQDKKTKSLRSAKVRRN